MRVLNLALDSKTLDPESVVAFRNRAYGTIVDTYTIIVPSPETVTVRLSDRVTVYGIGGKNKAWKLMRMYRFAAHLIKTGQCDVITAQDMYFLGFIGWLLSRRFHLGLEIQVLGIEKLNALRRRIALFVLKRASVVRALSNRLRDRLITEFGIPTEKINVVPIYVNVNKLGLDVRTLSTESAQEYEVHATAFRKKYADKFNFLTVSRLVPIKRIELQLAALKRVLETHPNTLLHIVGDGPDKEKLAALVSELSLSEHVIFHGYQSGHLLGMHYIECDCFLLTSDYEGWGMVLIEAATAGLPIIMTDVGCAGELIINNESGIVIPPGDLDSLIEAMKRLVEHGELRDALVRGALRALAELPEFDVILEKYKANWEVAFNRPL